MYIEMFYKEEERERESSWESIGLHPAINFFASLDSTPRLGYKL